VTDDDDNDDGEYYRKNKYFQLLRLLYFIPKLKRCLLKYLKMSRYQELLTQLNNPLKSKKHARLKVCNSLALPTYVCGTCLIGEQDMAS
jgi:hypothetical protein